MTIRHVAAGAALLAICALEACGGGTSGGSSLPATVKATPTPTAAPSSQIVESFTLTVPAASSTSAHIRQPRYVSSNTGSVRIAVQSVNGATSSLTPVVATIASGATGCTAGTGGSLVCTISVPAAVGLDVFAVSTYQSTNGTGTALATTNVAETVTASNPTPVALSLGGVPASIAFSPSVLPLVDDGAIHRFPITLEAVDASGATIVGAAPYASSISLQILGDPTHALSLSTQSVTLPGTVVTVTFDASKGLQNGSIQATGASVTASLSAAPLSVSPMPILVYDNQTVGAPVTLTQAGFTGTFTASLANAADGSVTVAAGPLHSGSAVATIVPNTTFDITQLIVGNGAFTAPVSVTIAPQPGTYTAYGSEHTYLQPIGMVKAPNGAFWTANPGTGNINSFNPSTQAYTTYAVDPSDQGPYGVAVDAQGNVWFADGPQIGELTPTTSNVQLFTTGLSANPNVTSITAGASGTMWFYDQGTNQPPNQVGQPSWFGAINTSTDAITEYATPDDATPTNPDGQAYMQMTLGPDGAIWFLDGSGAAVGRIATSGSYTITPIGTPALPTPYPTQLVVGPDGNIWFCEQSSSGASAFGTVAPSTYAVALYPVGTDGLVTALTVGSDHNLWFTFVQGAGFYSSDTSFGVVNPTTHAIYVYPTTPLPEFTTVGGIIDRGDRTLWVLNSSFGQVGEVPFK
jgi:virginiamycin B lyase